MQGSVAMEYWELSSPAAFPLTQACVHSC